MVKFRRGGFLALSLLVVACATAPAGPPPLPPPPPGAVEERPAEPVREAPLRIGVVVSSTGSPVLQRYAEMVLDGARIAAERASTARREVELVVRDDGGTAAGAAEAVRQLEAAGVQYIVGPLLDEAVIAAAAARRGEGTLLVSPTAVAQPEVARNVLALNVVDTRGAAALGRHARRHARVGVLYPRSPDQIAHARAFMDAYREGGGTLTEAPFDPGSTNVSAQMTQLRQARVEAIFLPATERHLQLLLPQIGFFGLGSVQLLGTETWLAPAIMSAHGRTLEGAIVATPLVRESPEREWQEFVNLYEQRYRRTLDSPIAALGFDAVAVAVRAATGPLAGEHRGATGVMALTADGVTRMPFLVRIQAGRLVPLN
jgi:ABC-type branched-subunit amino acid transport system substrate-binding protein